jgi:hypothetical protein
VRNREYFWSGSAFLGYIYPQSPPPSSGPHSGGPHLALRICCRGERGHS